MAIYKKNVWVWWPFCVPNQANLRECFPGNCWIFVLKLRFQWYPECMVNVRSSNQYVFFGNRQLVNMEISIFSGPKNWNGWIKIKSELMIKRIIDSSIDWINNKSWRDGCRVLNIAQCMFVRFRDNRIKLVRSDYRVASVFCVTLVYHKGHRYLFWWTDSNQSIKISVNNNEIVRTTTKFACCRCRW